MIEEKDEATTCGLQGYSGTTNYPDMMCVNGLMIDQDADGYDPNEWHAPCANCKPKEYAEWLEELRQEEEDDRATHPASSTAAKGDV